MFCNSCGKEIPDGTKFCTYCGAAQNPAPNPQDEQPAMQEPVIQEPVMQQDAQEQFFAPAQEDLTQRQDTPNDNTSFEQQQPFSGEMQFNQIPTQIPPKKSRKGLKIFLAIAIPVLLLGIAAVLYFTVFKDMFADDKTILKNAEKNTGVTATAEMLGNLTSGEIFNGTYKVEMDIAKQGRQLIQQLGGVDIDWFKGVDITVASEYDKENDSFELTGSIGINSEEIIPFSTSYDGKTQTVIIALPTLSDTAIKIDLPSIMNELDADFTETTEMLSSLENAIPDPEVIEDLLNKYIDLVLDSLEPVSEKTALTVNGVEQIMTTMTVNLSGKDVCDIATKILTEVKSDKDIKKIVENIAAVVDDEDATYDSFVEEIDELLDELKDKDTIESAPEIENISYIVDKKVVGRRISVDGEEILSYALAKADGKFGFEMYIGGTTLSVSGEGKCNGDKLTGDFEIYYEGEFVAAFSVEDFWFDGCSPRGTVKISGETFASLAGDYEDIVSQLELSVTFAENGLGLGASFGGAEILTASMNYSDKIESIKVTKPSDVLDVKDEDDMEEWAATIDVSRIMGLLTKAGVPVEDLISDAESLEDLF